MQNKEVIKERLEILPDNLSAFILNDSWRADIRNISGEFGFNEDSEIILENEVFMVLMGFESKSDFASNIKKTLGVNDDTARWVAEDVDRYIFSEVSEVLKQIENKINSTKPTNNESVSPSNNVGQSFERIILNQAKAMQPARLARESVASGRAREAGSGSQQPAPSSRVPDNLPTEDLKPKPTTPNYSGQDPYREPVE